MYNRLQPHESYINGHRFIPRCVHLVESATVCRCVKNGTSHFLDCSSDDEQEEVRIFRTTGTESCLSDGFGRRKKRSVSEQDVVDDDVILPDDIPIPPTPNTTEFPPPPTWPTASGITEQQARDACVKVLENYAAYNICREYVDLELVVEPCVLNIQVWVHIGLSILLLLPARRWRYACVSRRRVSVSVCVCVVCLSHSGIVSKRLNIVSRKQRHVIAQRL